MTRTMADPILPACASHLGPIGDPCTRCGQPWLAHPWSAADAVFARARALAPTAVLPDTDGYPGETSIEEDDPRYSPEIAAGMPSRLNEDEDEDGDA